MITGKETNSFAFKAGSSVAEAIGATRATGQIIGLATEFAVPLSTASMYNAFRVSSVRAGRISVITSEKPLQASKKLGGGHTIFKHVGKDLDYLKTRFRTREDPYTFHVKLEKAIGWGITRKDQSNAITMSNVTVVIKFVEYNRMPYYIVSAFPSL
ncbi:RNase A-like domain-containing protein [Pseudomonas alliivorans]|uniref:RNase A-like domain-containing protein n=1 Tax=Pseudomonas alliivorans TaxID=2810613 RepID=UPI001F2C3A39|nr:RNase A-like domain-containing protein [Pseudomonas alliivorans]